MRRIIALTLALLALFSLTACRSSEERKTMRRQMDLYYGKTYPDLPAELKLDNGVTAEPRTIYERNGVTVDLLGIYEYQESYILPLTLRNGGEQEVSWGCTGSGSVNGYPVNPWLSGDYTVCSHGMAVGLLQFDKSRLPLVVTPGPMSAHLFLQNRETAFYLKLDVDINTSAGEGVNRQPLCDTPFWSLDTLSLTLLSVERDSFTSRVNLLAENKGVGNYLFSLNNGSLRLNGLGDEDLSAWCYDYVDGGQQSVLSIQYSTYQASKAGLDPDDPLKTLDFSMEIRSLSGSKSHTVEMHIDVPQQDVG